MENNDDIVYLNVGGTKMATKRSTLCQVDGSVLASMFSGRWEDGIVRDEDGHVFLDYNPKLFAIVLDYLRAKKTETPNKPAVLPPVALEDIVNFRNLIEYLGVVNIQNNTDREDQVEDNDVKQRFELHSEGIELQENDTVASHKGTDHHEFVIGKDEVYANGEIAWLFCLKSVKQNSCLFFGVLDTRYRNSRVSESLTQRVNNTYTPPAYEWEGTFGWILRENLQTCSNGNVFDISNFGTLGNKGDSIELRLKTRTYDIDSSTELSLLLQPSGVKRRISLPDSQTWQCVIGSYYAGDCVSLLS